MKVLTKTANIKTAIKSLFILSIFAVSSIATASQSSGTILTNTYSTSVVCADSACTTVNQHRVNWKPTLVNDIQPITIIDGSGIRGQAWGENLGWVNFNITAANNIVPTTVNVNTGGITGYAWTANSGWINFSPTAVNNITGVSINSSGEFVGNAWVSGLNGGFMRFDCSGGATSTCVKTDWVPVPARSTTSGSGGSGASTGGGIVFMCLDKNAENFLAFTSCKYPTVFQQQTGENDLIGGINPNGGTEFEPNVPPEFKNQVCKRYLREYIYETKNNNPDEVKKLQSFLIENEGAKIVESGIFDAKTKQAVKDFQNKYADQILYPWGLTEATGVVGRTTVVKINLLSCSQKKGCPYFKTYMKNGEKGLDAVKIQDFLNIINAPTNGYPTTGISLTKDFNKKTFNSVKEFQSFYKDTVLKPWGLTSPTGWWYKTTRHAANKLMNCAEGGIVLDNGAKVE